MFLHAAKQEKDREIVKEREKERERVHARERDRERERYLHTKY